ncbi:hypothetical protein BGZ95_002610 [Linnemannia exigua]|uniref:Myb-like domain-containing protein n=1 Tax=Linnemannia exigua TaxID=604196 RepID=A0AAD4DIE0_9FUNG|nr:hypothetical protein BGZ95_002610 [Linnemannia exigua]
MARLTRSTAASASSNKTAAANNYNHSLLSASQQVVPTPQPAKRASRRLAHIKNHATSFESLSNTPGPVLSDVYTSAVTKSVRTKERSSLNRDTQNDAEEVSNGENFQKENWSPTPQQTRNSENDKQRERTKKGSEPTSILATQADTQLSIEADCGNTLATTIPTKDSPFDISHQKQQERTQQKHTEENTDTPIASLQGKRKWSRRTKVVKLEEDSAVALMAVSGKVEEGGDEVEETDEESNTASNSEDSDEDYGKSSKRTKIEKPVPRFKSQGDTELSEYERQRLENIRRNQEMLLALELPTAVTQLQIATLEGKPAQENDAFTGELFNSTPMPVKISRQREWKAMLGDNDIDKRVFHPSDFKAAPKIVRPVRVSNRIRGVEITPTMIGENDKPEQGSLPHKNQHSTKIQGADIVESAQDDIEGEHEDDMTNLMSGDLFFDKATRERAIRVDGHYHGWLDPGVVERYGFERNAKDAWEANGGGSFSFKAPLGAQADAAGTTRSKTSKRPKHEAKMIAKGLFKKNPNAFFYRHNEPGQEQWTGDWTADEQEIFLRVAAENGCGDKWGLFASHIPHRVGYQCSNFYRQVVLPEGLVFDPNYEYTSRGKPIYCGKHNQWRK